MDIQYFGANCLVLTSKDSRLVVDDNLNKLGAKSVLKPADIALFTSDPQPKVETKLVINHPGEYEVASFSIHGIPARAHMDEEGAYTATMYKIVAGDLHVLVTGHIYPDLSEAQQEDVGHVDVMIIPVGGGGYTLDPVGAQRLIREIGPKLVIPTHYADKNLKYEVPQLELEDALKELGIEQREPEQKLRLKPADLGEVTQLIVVEKS
jgi:L-ascorbate metabolism protein UlaG (beta-lactamase superfamily)